MASLGQAGVRSNASRPSSHISSLWTRNLHQLTSFSISTGPHRMAGFEALSCVNHDRLSDAEPVPDDTQRKELAALASASHDRNKSVTLRAGKQEQLEAVDEARVDVDKHFSGVNTGIRGRVTRSQTLVRMPGKSPNIAHKWREIQGASSWKEMLDPLDSDLRSEIIRYGEFAQATYDAFDSETTSRYCGSAKYDPEKMLDAVGLPNTGYRITKYIYATSEDLHLVPDFFRRPDVMEDAWSKDSNWVGFVAVCTAGGELSRQGRRDIVLAWRGTVTSLEWKENVRDYLTPMQSDPHPHSPSRDLKVEKGFWDMYSSRNPHSRYNKSSAQEQILAEVRRLVDEYQSQELSITVTGHSLGGAFALLCAYDIAALGYNCGKTPANIPVTVFNFASPRVGNDAFRRRLEKTLGVKVLRVVNDQDTVPKLPGLIANEKFPLLQSFLDWLPWTYSHVGVEFLISSKESTCLDHSKSDLVTNHSLELYLHLVDAFESRVAPFANFDPETSRDVALLNRYSDILDKQYRVPANWWQEKNKGLVFDKTRQRWRQQDRDPENIPVTFHKLPS